MRKQIIHGLLLNELLCGCLSWLFAPPFLDALPFYFTRWQNGSFYYNGPISHHKLLSQKITKQLKTARG
jgi:hypothetical protein